MKKNLSMFFIGFQSLFILGTLVLNILRITIHQDTVKEFKTFLCTKVGYFFFSSIRTISNFFRIEI